MHMINKKDLNSAEIDTLTKSCSPAIVITANGEVQTYEEAIVYVKELDIFLTMKLPRIRQQSYRSESFAMKTDILDQRSKTTSHEKRYSNTEYYGEFRSVRGSMLVSMFFLQFSFFNINDTLKTGK